MNSVSRIADANVRQRCLNAFVDSYARIHMVGIGGVGMEGLTRFLHQLGCQVSGSDNEYSSVLAELEDDGIVVQLGHNASFVEPTINLLVYSAAVAEDNEERVEATSRGIKTMSRAQLVAELSSAFCTIAVAGTHGKTTTAAMLFEILQQNGSNPSSLIGGRRGGRAIAGLGTGDLLVLEADEYDRSFLHLNPWMALITNVEAEHLEDTYKDESAVVDAFAEFAGAASEDGHLLINGDDPGCLQVFDTIDRKDVDTFGFGSTNDFRADCVELHLHSSEFDLVSSSHSQTLSIGVPGRHNVANAIAAASAAHRLQAGIEAVQLGLGGFHGVQRRFEIKDEVGGILVVEDYAHHPTEVRVAIEAARLRGRPVIVVFQPHLFTRTRIFMEQFAGALKTADQVYLTNVYGAREVSEDGEEAMSLCRMMQMQGFESVRYVPEKFDLIQELIVQCNSGDVILFMGAGDIGEVADRMVDDLRQRAIV